MSKSNDSFLHTLKVILAVSLVCSIVVSVAAVGLKPTQLKNKALDTQRFILRAANLLEPGMSGGDITETFNTRVETRVLDLAANEFVGADTIGVEPTAFDQRAAAKDPAMSQVLSAADDPAGIKRRANFVSVYLVKDDSGEVESIILPMHGNGLWSTMYAFVAVKPDGKTVTNLVYYDQGETPGLGGEVANPNWLAQWPGKQLVDVDGNPAIEVTKAGQADANSPHEIDGLSGATLTANGVQYTFDFWLSDKGFGPFLAKVREGGLIDG